MELTVTPPSTPSPSPSVLDRLRKLFGGQSDDGRLGSKVKAARALDLVRDGATLLDVRESSEWKSGHAPGPSTSHSATLTRPHGACTKVDRSS